VRNKFSYKIDDFDELIAKLIYYTKDYKFSCLLHSNISNMKVPKKYYQYDAIFAFDSIKSIKSNNDSLNKLQSFHNKEKDWLFGYLSYNLKNEIYDLSSNNIKNIEVDNLTFFIPKHVFLIKNNNLYIESIYSKDMINILYSEIMKQKVLELASKEIKLIRRDSKKSYLEKIGRIKENIQRGDIYEMNFCQEFYQKNAIVSPQNLFLNLNKITESPFASFLMIDNISLIGASPERYLLKDKNTVISQPIKGTSKRSLNAKEDNLLVNKLKNSPKDLSENIMIVDLVRNDLSITALNSSVNVDKLCGVYTFNNVHQMISTVSSKVKTNTSFTDIIRTSFPMGSMTGAPKFRSMNLIEKYETTKRGLFSGSVGYVTPSADFDFNVVIRSLLYDAKSKYLSVSVGGAITCQSDAEEEYEECLIKVKPIFESLKFVLDEK